MTAAASTCCKAAHLPERRDKEPFPERIRIRMGRDATITAASFSPATPDPKTSPDFSHDDFTSVSAAAFRSDLFAAHLSPVPSVPSLVSISISRIPGRAFGVWGALPGRAPPRRPGAL